MINHFKQTEFNERVTAYNYYLQHPKDIQRFWYLETTNYFKPLWSLLPFFIVLAIYAFIGNYFGFTVGFTFILTWGIWILTSLFLYVWVNYIIEKRLQKFQQYLKQPHTKPLIENRIASLHYELQLIDELQQANQFRFKVGLQKSKQQLQAELKCLKHAIKV